MIKITKTAIQAKRSNEIKIQNPLDLRSKV